MCFAHSVHHHGQHSRGEREEDGAFSPRDTGHFTEDGGHHGEFDHEAILGILQFLCILTFKISISPYVCTYHYYHYKTHLFSRKC